MFPYKIKLLPPQGRVWRGSSVTGKGSFSRDRSRKFVSKLRKEQGWLLTPSCPGQRSGVDIGQKQGGQAGLGQLFNTDRWRPRHNVSHRISRRTKLSQPELARAPRREYQPREDHQHRLCAAICDPLLLRALCLRGLLAASGCLLRTHIYVLSVHSRENRTEFIVPLKSEVGLGRVLRI